MTISPAAGMTLGVIFEGVLYGAYIVLFILYLILRRRNNRAVDAPLALSQILLFGLCTVSLCLDIPTAYFFIVPNAENEGIFNKLSEGSIVIFTSADYLAQMILLYRCWIVWGRRWVVVVVSGFLALVSFSVGLGFAIFSGSPLWSTDPEKASLLYVSFGILTYSASLVANALTTSLIVTRILLTSREVRSVLGSNLHRSFRIVTAMLIESGILIFASQLVFVILFSIRNPAEELVSYPSTQILGITSTLLNIRVLMGSTYDGTTEKTGSLRFARSGEAATRTTGLSTNAAEAQSRSAIPELRDASNKGGAADNVV